MAKHNGVSATAAEKMKHLSHLSGSIGGMARKTQNKTKPAAARKKSAAHQKNRKRKGKRM